MDSRPDGRVRPIWSPGSNDERNFYDNLFHLADVTNTGKLAGQPAVAFLGRSGLTMPILKQVRDYFQSVGFTQIEWVPRLFSNEDSTVQDW